MNLGRQHPTMFWKKGSKILKLQINSLSSLTVLKYQKLRKFYYMKLNFLYQITSASRTPD